MTKEELKQEAQEYAKPWKNSLVYVSVKDSYLAGAEPREKRIEELEKENAELKAENQKWKDEWQEQVQKANDEGYARTLQTIQLNKAKEIISEWEDSFCRGTDYIYLGNKGKELRSKSQKFLNSEVDNALS